MLTFAMKSIYDVRNLKAALSIQCFWLNKLLLSDGL